MQRLAQDRETVTLQISSNEAATLSNALNETLESLDEWEFATRMGVSKEEVVRLLEEFSRLFADVTPSGSSATVVDHGPSQQS